MDSLKTRCIAAATAVWLAGSTSAGAVAMSMNEVELASGTSVAACKAAGRTALMRAGLEALPEAPVSVFGSGGDGLLATIYCLPHRGIAIVAVAGPEQAVTRATLGQLLNAMQGAAGVQEL